MAFVYVIAFNSEGRFLMVKHVSRAWEMPGGRVEPGESPEEAAKREFREETGLEIEPVKLVGIYSEPERDPRKIIGAAYIVKRIGGELKPGDDAGEAKWFDLDNIPDELAFDHKKIVEDSTPFL